MARNQPVQWQKTVSHVLHVAYHPAILRPPAVIGSTLNVLERKGVFDCEICGFPHIHHDSPHNYRAVVIASEPITREYWQEVPDRHFWVVTNDNKFEISQIWSANTVILALIYKISRKRHYPRVRRLRV